MIDDIVKIEKSPFHIGDQLIKINGKRLASLQDLIDIVGSTKIGEDLHFHVIRPNLIQQNDSIQVQFCHLKNKKEEGSRIKNGVKNNS